MKLESASGMIMIFTALLAIIIANSPLAASYKNFISYPLVEGFSVKDFAKDGLMVLFFLMIGMELKKEILEGFLSRRDQILLPLFVAVAGMAVPAIIYSIFNTNILATQNGWAIPSATDIAFALCVLSIFGRSVPPSVKIFLLAIAIFDDLGAILVIAFFYSSGFHLSYLFLSALVIGIMYLMNRREIPHIWGYFIGGAVLVLLFEHAGIHTTVAGVITGFLIPLRLGTQKNSPLENIMHKLHPWVSFGVLPVFAFVSAGVSLINFDTSMLFSPVALGVATGLFLGKQIGIFGATWALVKLKYVALPEAASWKDIYAVAALSGIGFTMSLFISQLAFTDPVFQEEAKLGILAGSLLSAVLGIIILKKKN